MTKSKQEEIEQEEIEQEEIQKNVATLSSDPTMISKKNAWAVGEKKEHNLKSLVWGIINACRGYNAKFNAERTLAVLDLGTQGAHQGTKYRQLFVEATQGFMRLSLREGFSSAHGGEAQRKVLFSFSVSVAETELYAELQTRFFGYNEARNLGDGVVLLDALEKTVG